MAPQKGTSRSTLRIVLFAFSLVLAGALFKIDTEVPLGIAIGALYTVVIFFSWLLQGKYDTLILAVICSVLLMVGFFNSPVPSLNKTSAEINRVISLILIWVCSMLVILAKKGFDGVEKALENLEDKVRDRTRELFQSREELKESERLYRYLYENAHEMYVSVDPHTAQIVKCNETLCEKLGYERNEIIGQPIFMVYHEDCMPQVKQAFEQFKKDGEVRNTELILETKSGRKLDVILNVSAATDDTGEIMFSRSSWIDVTEYKKSQNTLKEQDAQMRSLVQSATDAIFTSDHTGKITSWNAAAERIFGWAEKEVLGKPMTMIIPEKTEKSKNEFTQVITKGGKSQLGRTMEQIGFNSNGKKFPIEISLGAWKAGDNHAFVGIVRDLTERKRAEKAMLEKNLLLEQQNKELEQFVYIASHDLQEPLRTVTSFTELLATKYDDTFDEEGKKGMSFILEATARMRNLILGLLMYGRIGKDREIETVNCNELIKNVTNDLKSKIDETNAKIEVGKLPGKLRAYPTEIAQLFQNLVTNAIKFRNEKTTPKVHISSTQKNGHFQFAVKDNGIGFKEEHKDRIFKIFQRLHSRNKYAGTGIGLANCKKIVDLHQGKMWVESTPEKGSTFYFTIPK